jgi:hypothetical protein
VALAVSAKQALLQHSEFTPHNLADEQLLSPSILHAD